MQDSSDSDDAILFDFADQLLFDRDSGRMNPLAHYLARFPGHEERVAREYLRLTASEAAGAAPTAVRRLDRIGPYRLDGILGRGGQGVVYRAEDTRLERCVALKVLTLPVASVSQGRRNRFRREAAIVSRLDHPGICTVLDADLDGEHPYIAMRFVEGETLAAALARVRGSASAAATPTPESGASTSASRLLAPRRALELSETLSFFERAARALHAAHEAGVVHRDIKPGNIMVSKDGAPVILDFGLARDAEEESALLTRSDEVFGTPAYISPEQLHSGRHVDRRTDVYSLGVVLYECLTLSRPFQGDSSAALAQSIRDDPVPSARRLNPALPPDLSIVLETALEKDVARRYPTALELAEELRRLRAYEPIQARPAGALLRLRRWSQRNPVIATATIGSIAALSTALAVALFLLGRVNQEKRDKEAALARYESAWYRDQAAGALGFSPPRSLHFAIAAAEREPGLSSNRVLLAALEALYSKQVLVGHEKMVHEVDIDPDTRRVLSCSEDGTARLWDPETGAQLAEFRHSDGAVLCARFSPDGDNCVTTGQDGRAFLWSTRTPTAPPRPLVGHAQDVHWAVFSPDGARVVTAGRDGTARIWSVVDQRELVRLDGHAGSIAEARFVAGGRRVLTRSAEPAVGGTRQESDATVRLFDADSGAQVGVFRGHTAAVLSYDVSPDGHWLVTTSEDRSARLWLLDGTEPEPRAVRLFEAPGKFHAAAFSPDGRRLALAWDAGARVVEVESGAVRYELPSHESRAVVRIQFSPDGMRLATLAYDDALRVFDAADGALLRVCRGDARQVKGLRWSPDGSFLATWQRLTRVDLWYGTERPFLQRLRGHTGAVRTARFDRSGERVVTASADGTARTWNGRDGAFERAFDPAAHGRRRVPLVAARFDPAGTRVVTTDHEGRVALWNAATGSILYEHWGGEPTETAAEFSPDGTRVALSAGGGAVLLVDLDRGRERRLAAHEGGLVCLCFSPDGTRLVTGGADRRVCAWDASFAVQAPAHEERREPLWRSEPFTAELYSLQSVFDVAVSGDGRWAVAACQNLRLLLFDLRDGRLCDQTAVATPGHVAFAGDGRLLMGTSKYLRFTTLWRVADTPDGARFERLALPDLPGHHHTNSMTSVAVARHAPRAVTGSLDRGVRLWDLQNQRCIASYVGHEDVVLDADITADGARIVTASADGTARLWPGDLLATARAAEPAALANSFGPLPTPGKGD